MYPDSGMFDGFFGVFFFTCAAFVLAGLGLFARLALKGFGEWTSNNRAPVSTVPATVVAKRDQHRGATPDTAASTSYFVTFELADGTRLEFPMPGAQFGLLAEHDRGRLTHQGTRFKTFARLIEER